MMLLFISRETRIKKSLPAEGGQQSTSGPNRYVSNAQLFERMGFKRKVVRPDGTVVRL
jgi:hypothetical protein